MDNWKKSANYIIDEQNHQSIATNIDNNTLTTTTQVPILPYKSKKGEKTDKFIR